MGTMESQGSDRRTYGQHCGIAYALDLVGERWTLLAVRELLLGPLRYTDLLEGLPGIGTNLLARRLRDLERAGIVERQLLPPPAASAVYALTRCGKMLEPAIIELGRFGGRFLPDHPTQTFRPRWAVTGLKHTFHAVQARGLHVTYQLFLNGEAYFAKVDDGVLYAQQGQAGGADITIRTTAVHLLELLSGHLDVRTGVTSGLIEIEGRAEGLEEFVGLFGWNAARERGTSLRAASATAGRVPARASPGRTGPGGKAAGGSAAAATYGSARGRPHKTADNTGYLGLLGWRWLAGQAWS